MGICSNSKLKKEINTDQIIFEKLDNELPIFRDMPLWEDEKFKGEGIKKMRAYKCNIPINELNKVREEFWNHKIKKNSIWRCIKQACAMDEVRASNRLNVLGLGTVEGCINLLTDSKGNFYRVPNYCINDPYFEKIITVGESLSNLDRSTKNLEINIYDLYNNKKIKMSFLDNTAGKDFKEKYCKAENIDINTHKIRAIFGGAEIKDDHKLYNHDIKNNFTVQLMVLPN